VASRGQERKEYAVFVEKPEVKRSPGRTMGE
jgi:hypothetical protein